MDYSILEDIGLTTAEIKVFLALLELGTATAGPIMEKAGTQNSVTHSTLASLVEKGLISYVKKGHVRNYQTADPDILLKFIDKKRNKLNQLLPELIARQKLVEKQEVEIYEGLRGHRVMLYDFIEDAKKGDEYLFLSFFAKNADDFDDIFELYNEFSKDRRRIGLKTKGIAPIQIKGKFKDRFKGEELLFVDFPILTNITIFKNKVFMTPWEDRKMSFLIHSRQLAEMYRQYFYSIWDKYKKDK